MKSALAILAARLKELTRGTSKQLDEILLLFKSDTVLKWHRELIRRKWTYQRTNLGGRARTTPELEQLMMRLAKENPRWGYGKIQGEQLKLGYSIGRSTVRDVLARRHIPPTNRRCKNSNHRRAHQGIGQRVPIRLTEEISTTGGLVGRRDVLGGIIHDYYQECPRAA